MNGSGLYKLAKRLEKSGQMDKAYEYYLEAAMTEDDAKAMYALADMYFNGDYVRKDYDKAGLYFGMAYDHGMEVAPEVLIMAGSYWESHSGDQKENISLAIRYFQAAADLGLDYGYECLGQIRYMTGEYDKALDCLQKAETLSTHGLFYMGKLYDEGRGVKKDREKAVYYYKKVLEAGADIEKKYGPDDDIAGARKRLRELAL